MLAEALVDDVALPGSGRARAKVLEGARLEHLAVSVAEGLGQFVLAYVGYLADRLEMGRNRAPAFLFPAASRRVASQLVKRFVRSRNLHQPLSTTKFPPLNQTNTISGENERRRSRQL